MNDTGSKLQVKQEPKSTPARERNLWGWGPLDSLRRDVDRLFEDFTRGFPSSVDRFWASPLWKKESGIDMMIPAIDVVEEDKNYVISAELPGLDEKDIEVKVANDTLAIRGEKKEEKEERDKNYYVSERRYGTFQRSFQLPLGTDADKIEAKFEKGVLRITLPKTAEAQQKEKKIAIKAG